MTGAIHEPGRTAYEARFAGETIGKRGVAPAWADLPEDARAIWRRVEESMCEAVEGDGLKLLKLTTELCDAIDAETADVGTGSRGSLTILREIGPLVDRMNRTFRASHAQAQAPAEGRAG
ncbi:MAG: hypothetical protein K2X72_10395 [Reyranella sp.]|nr:hypothetical protein [Reyranella sp.]